MAGEDNSNSEMEGHKPKDLHKKVVDEDDYESFATEDENPMNEVKEERVTVGMDLINDPTYSHLDIIKGDEPIKCDGGDCTKTTTRPSGYCEECEKKYEPLLRATMMQCPNCPAVTHCRYSKNELQICIYELREDKRKLRDKDEVTKIMRDVISMDKKMYDRYARFTASTVVGENGIMFNTYAKELKAWANTMFDHIKHYSIFMGWNKSTLDKEMLDARAKAMKAAMGRKVKSHNYTHDKEPVVDDKGKIVVKVETPENNNDENYDYDNEKEEDFGMQDVEDVEKEIAEEDDTLDEDMMMLEDLEAEFMGNKEKEEDEEEKE